jgi:putative glutamine amidotransferase
MPVHIAVPEPTSSDQEYNQRTLPAYIAALQAAGATPVVIPLGEGKDSVVETLANVQGILLPGSLYDVDPKRFGEDRIPECGEDDPARTAIDEWLLRDAFNLHKPILAICHGTQGLNVWRNGSLIQDLKTPVNHSPGRQLVEAHSVQITKGSKLAGLLPQAGATQDAATEAQVNSSHHQAIHSVGDNLLVTAVSSEDGVIEAVELDSADHFVLGVQWHPERTYNESALSRAIFAAFVEAAETWESRPIEDSVA